MFDLKVGTDHRKFANDKGAYHARAAMSRPTIKVKIVFPKSVF